MSEQELYMMVEDRGKDEFSAQNLMKKHEALEGAVADYSENVRQLGEVARQLQAEDHPQSETIGVRLSQVEKLYAGLKELSNERRAKLDDALKLFMLNRQVHILHKKKKTASHFSEIRGLRSTKCSRKTLQNLLYFMYKKTHVVFFSFFISCNFIFLPYECPGLC